MPRPPETDRKKRLARLRELQHLAQLVLGTKEGSELLRHLEARFEVRLPSFRSSDGYSDKGAAIRDGEKGVVQYLRLLRDEPVESWPTTN